MDSTIITTIIIDIEMVLENTEMALETTEEVLEITEEVLDTMILIATMMIAIIITATIAIITVMIVLQAEEITDIVMIAPMVGEIIRKDNIKEGITRNLRDQCPPERNHLQDQCLPERNHLPDQLRHPFQNVCFLFATE